MAGMIFWSTAGSNHSVPRRLECLVGYTKNCTEARSLL